MLLEAQDLTRVAYDYIIMPLYYIMQKTIYVKTSFCIHTFVFYKQHSGSTRM